MRRPLHYLHGCVQCRRSALAPGVADGRRSSRPMVHAINTRAAVRLAAALRGYRVLAQHGWCGCCRIRAQPR